jgi:hypothetical protein
MHGLGELVCGLMRIGIIIDMPRQVLTATLKLHRLWHLFIMGLAAPPVCPVATALALIAPGIGALVL